MIQIPVDSLHQTLLIYDESTSTAYCRRLVCENGHNGVILWKVHVLAVTRHLLFTLIVYVFHSISMTGNASVFSFILFHPAIQPLAASLRWCNGEAVGGFGS